MDEHLPRRHGIVQSKFLCETLYHDCLVNLEEGNHGQVSGPASAIDLRLNELIEHVAAFALNYKIKYNEDSEFIEQIDEYLDDTFMLFSSHDINTQNPQEWQKSGNRLLRCFVSATKENPASLSYQDYYNHGWKYVRETFDENRLFNAFTSLSDNWYAGTRCREK